MESSLVMMAVTAIVGVAAWTLTLWMLREPPPRPTPQRILLSPLDGDPHTLTALGPNGRPNPLHYERAPDYRAALARQQELARHGITTIITHSETGQVRIDWSTWLGPYGRITL